MVNEMMNSIVSLMQVFPSSLSLHNYNETVRSNGKAWLPPFICLPPGHFSLNTGRVVLIITVMICFSIALLQHQKSPNKSCLPINSRYITMLKRHSHLIDEGLAIKALSTLNNHQTNHSQVVTITINHH